VRYGAERRRTAIVSNYREPHGRGGEEPQNNAMQLLRYRSAPPLPASSRRPSAVDKSGALRRAAGAARRLNATCDLV
jgi:hypothetical protein